MSKFFLCYNGKGTRAIINIDAIEAVEENTDMCSISIAMKGGRIFYTQTYDLDGFVDCALDDQELLIQIQDTRSNEE